MCGIAGALLSDANGRVDVSALVCRMSLALKHRGPDDEGLVVRSGGRVALVNRRLAIRDISPAGHMPMSSPDGHLWITYNGEIYNTDELRPELEVRGYVFHSSSDAEVILRGYEEWGEAVVERLRGIFAFGILDLRPEAGDGRLFLARDRLGVKPLYYASTPRGFVFASELKGLLASGMVSHDLSAAGLVGYLTMGSVPCPLTIYRDVHALEAASMLTVPVDLHARPQPHRYWRLPTDTEDSGDDAGMAEHVRALLEGAVGSQLVSDVPLGAFLSGGLDSSAVVALMRRATSGTIRTCSMVFEETEYSEAPYARAMAEAVGADHYERTVTAAEVARELPSILGAMDQPSVDGINTYFVSQTAREAGLTVALSGLGGDELFGGYASTFQGVPQMLRALRLTTSVPGGAVAARSVVRALPDQQRWARTRDALAQPASLASAYLTRRGLFAPSEVRKLVASDVWCDSFQATEYIAERTGNNGHDPSAHRGTFAWVSRAELTSYTHNQLLRDTDVMSMAHSLEVRVPLLDERLVEAVLRLPPHVHQRSVGPKHLLFSAVEHELPPIIRERRRKQGFVFPFDSWMRGPLGETVEMMTDRTSVSPWLRGEEVRDVWTMFRAGKVHWSRPWALAVLASSLAQAG